MAKTGSGGLFDHPFEASPYNPDKDRERIRGAVALSAMLVFVLLMVFYFYEATHANPATWSQVEESLKVMLPAVTSVMGTVLGFYFGSK